MPNPPDEYIGFKAPPQFLRADATWSTQPHPQVNPNPNPPPGRLSLVEIANLIDQHVQRALDKEENSSTASQIADHLVELNTFRSIVAKLPKTRDGKPIVLGPDKVYRWIKVGSGLMPLILESIGPCSISDYALFRIPENVSHEPCWRVDDSYSTRELAIEAYYRENKTEPAPVISPDRSKRTVEL